MKSTPFLDRCFQLASLLALLGWAMLLLIPDWVRAHPQAVLSAVASLCVFYVLLLWLGGRWDSPGTAPRGNFRSMRGVLRLFESPRAVLVGWVHFLAFDLLVGLFILIDAESLGLHHLLLVPILLLTLMFGPAGLLLYLAVRLAIS